ncbi:solute carrier family 26 member 6-like isoform x2 protein [Lasius niger]|uniref:Solute carrier family 26 member 6-like isoform x2 protein n=1 Tax=Lasius niger TaxID=67767 RepID=A0A0J7KVS2_LASNI|nr:solute carrier family 26 member 6-like isoform x2 protein [Lasius niger]
MRIVFTEGFCSFADYSSDDMSTTAPELTVRRPVYQQDELNHLCKYVKPKRILSNEVSRRCKNIKPMTLLKKSIPLIDWLSSYNWKNNILGDIIAGITVAVMHIPQVPSVPPLSIIPNILVDSFVITMVAYTISMSMALIFAQKMGYEVDSNQELVAQCILASIIVVALKGMLVKVTEFVKFWRLDKTDAGIWAVTFVIVVLFDIEYGLLVGVLLCVGRLLVLAVRPYTCKLALAPGTELYLDARRYKGTVEIPGIKIFHYSGSLNFASRQYFRERVYKIAELVPQKELNRRLKVSCNGVATEEIKKLRILILDFTALSHIDLAGANAMRSIVDEYCSIGVSVYITGCSGPVYETMRKYNLAEHNENHFFAMFPTVADAVHFARSHSEVSSIPAWNTRIHDENCISRL